MRSLQPFSNRDMMVPFQNMQKLMNQFEELFNEMSPGIGSQSLADRKGESVWDFSPSVDIEENDELYLVTADLPGLKKEDIKVDISGNTLKISGGNKREIKEEGYYERSSGRFYRSFTLPEGVDAQKVEANFEDGVLKIAIPKTEVKHPQQVKIQSGAPQGLLERLFNSDKKEDKAEEKSKEKVKH